MAYDSEWGNNPQVDTHDCEYCNNCIKIYREISYIQNKPIFSTSHLIG